MIAEVRLAPQETTVKQLRAELRREFGPRRYRITRENEIHVYGTMPNTNQVGWWLYGFAIPQIDKEPKA